MSKFISLSAFTRYDKEPIIIPINTGQIRYILPVRGYKDSDAEIVFEKGNSLIVEESFDDLQKKLENL